MWKVLCLALLAFLVSVLASDRSTASSHEDPADVAAKHKPDPKLETLLKTKLEGVGGTEVIVSRVSIPANTSLPKHWHPGEEFAYILEGSVVLWQEGKDEIVGKQGDVVKVPLKQVHTAFTRDEDVTILVFRVHEEGQPERIPIE
jgi:quercetin dioxygenase-like cupin family protein